MNAKPKRILVLGGKGFVGSHAVSALSAGGAAVVVGTRSPRKAEARLEEREFHLERMLSPESWAEAAAEFDVILNCVGILRPQWRASYEKVHHLAPYALAIAAARYKTRFVHVSALGLQSGDRSGFLTSKRNGENAIQSTQGDWILARPSLLDGEGGFGAAWLRGVSRLPFFVVPADAKGQIAALIANDLGEGLARLCLGAEAELGLKETRVFELGGPRAFDFESYILGLRARYTDREAAVLRVPGIVARIFAHLCDAVYFSPFTFGHWELLRRDNIASPNRLPELLGRVPSEVISRS